MHSVAVLFTLFTSGHCLSCLTCDSCDIETKVFSTKCSSTQDVCLSNKTENSVYLRCGQFQECDESHLKELSSNVLRWINKQIKFEDLFKEEKGTSIDCCKGDNCNKMFIKDVTVMATNDKENIVPEVANINNAESVDKHITPGKLYNSSYIVPKLLKLTVKRDAMESTNDEKSSVSGTNQKSKSSKRDNDYLSANSTTIATETSDGTTEVATDLITPGDSSSTSAGWSSQYWSFVTLELLIFISLCNFRIFFMSLI